jgi:hypothetical protein
LVPLHHQFRKRRPDCKDVHPVGRVYSPFRYLGQCPATRVGGNLLPLESPAVGPRRSTIGFPQQLRTVAAYSGPRPCVRLFADARPLVSVHVDRLRQDREKDGILSNCGADVDTPYITKQVCKTNRPWPNRMNLAPFVNLQRPGVTTSPRGIARLLNAYGPLIYCGRTNPLTDEERQTHHVVIRGIKGSRLLIDDPWPDSRGKETIHSYDFLCTFQKDDKTYFMFI